MTPTQNGFVVAEWDPADGFTALAWAETQAAAQALVDRNQAYGADIAIHPCSTGVAQEIRRGNLAVEMMQAPDSDMLVTEDEALDLFAEDDLDELEDWARDEAEDARNARAWTHPELISTADAAAVSMAHFEGALQCTTWTCLPANLMSIWTSTMTSPRGLAPPAPALCQRPVRG